MRSFVMRLRGRLSHALATAAFWLNCDSAISMLRKKQREIANNRSERCAKRRRTFLHSMSARFDPDV